MIRFRTIVLAATLAWCGPSFGQGQPVADGARLDLTLRDTIALALKNNRDLLDARLARTIEQFTLEVAGDRYRPTADIEPSVRLGRGGETTTDASVSTGLRVPTGGRFTMRWSTMLDGADDTSDTVTLGFSQPLLRGFGMDVDTAPLRVAQLGERINVLAFRDVIAEVVDSAIHAWRDLVQADRELAIGEASLARAREQIEVNRRLIAAGQMAERELLQSEGNVAQAELALVQVRNGVTSANFALIDILDIDDATTIRPIEWQVAPHPEVSVGQAMETALAHSPDHAQALLAREIAEIGLRVARNERLWDLSLDVNASRDTGSDASTDVYMGVRLSAALLDRNPKLRLMSARADVERADRSLRESRQSLAIAVRQAIHDVDVGRRRIDLARKARRLAQETLEIERSKLRQGLSSTFHLGRFEDELVEAQNAEVDALIGYRNALTALDRTLGTTLQTWGIEVERIGR